MFPMETVKIEGLSDLEAQLERLTKAAGKGVLRRSLKKAATPMAEAWRDKAPRGDTAMDRLANSGGIGTKLSKRQAALHRKMFRDDRASVEMFVGPGPDPAAWNQEFGNSKHGAQPFLRPAFDEEVKPTLDRLGDIMWEELDKSLVRAARKAERSR